jgi:hypothetical protein
VLFAAGRLTLVDATRNRWTFRQVLHSTFTGTVPTIAITVCARSSWHRVQNASTSPPTFDMWRAV